jgi:hypothetical protein
MIRVTVGEPNFSHYPTTHLNFKDFVFDFSEDGNTYRNPSTLLDHFLSIRTPETLTHTRPTKTEKRKFVEKNCRLTYFVPETSKGYSA